MSGSIDLVLRGSAALLLFGFFSFLIGIFFRNTLLVQGGLAAVLFAAVVVFLSILPDYINFIFTGD